MCGISGVLYPDGDPIDLAYFMEYCLQHRGQESFGIAASDGEKMVITRQQGLVSAFAKEEYNRLIRNGNFSPVIAIAHNRYSNTGGDDFENYQPFIVQTKFGKISLVHNGNIPDISEIAKKLHRNGFDPDGDTDSEIIAQLIAYCSYKNHVESIEESIIAALKQIKGAYSIIVMTSNKLIGLRDPWGVRPLCCGQLNGNGYVFSSETSAIEAIGAEWICDVKAGEMIIVESSKEISHQMMFDETCERLCLFEPIYFSAPASVIGDRLLKTARRHMGNRLWDEHPVAIENIDEWIVGGVPDTGVPAAQGYAEASGIEYRDIFQRNRAIGRTFIQPDQRLRELGVKLKLLPYRREIRGKKLVVVEDSIVRSTTMGQLVPLLREAGAIEVHVRISSPPYKHRCLLGTDTQRTKELIAAKMSVEEICAHIGADSLGYLSLEGLIESIDPLPGNGFCSGCFNRSYPFEMPEELPS